MGVTKTLREARPDDYGILVLTGGKAPEAVREEHKAVELEHSNKPKISD